MEVGSFLPASGRAVTTYRLDRRAETIKKRMIECFVTQHSVLASFPAGYERFRVAPSYDFAAPPHAGSLFYESFDWGVTGVQWRALAKTAASELGVELS
jgi:hypothetical protein